MAILTGTACNYDPKLDQSGFVTAKLADDDHTAIYSCQRLVYRPARGLAAFPDGGVPKNLVDTNVLGVVDIESKQRRVLIEQPNDYWAHGHGRFHVTAVMGSTALVSQSGQRRADLGFETQRYLLNTNNGELRPLRLRERLAPHDRSPGYIYLVRGDGTLVMVGPSVDEAKRGVHWQRDRSIEPEIWVRTRDDEFHRVAQIPSSNLYEGFRDGQVFYWLPTDRRHRAWNIHTGVTRVVADPRRTSAAVTLGVGITSDKQALEIQRKVDGGWEYEPLTDMQP